MAELQRNQAVIIGRTGDRSLEGKFAVYKGRSVGTAAHQMGYIALKVPGHAGTVNVHESAVRPLGSSRRKRRSTAVHTRRKRRAR